MNILILHRIKGTVRVILCNHPCKDSNARFTTVPLKALHDQVSIFLFLNCFFLHLRFLCENDLRISCLNEAIKKLLKFNTVLRKFRFQGYCCESGIVFFHGGSL